MTTNERSDDISDIISTEVTNALKATKPNKAIGSMSVLKEVGNTIINKLNDFYNKCL